MSRQVSLTAKQFELRQRRQPAPNRTGSENVKGQVPVAAKPFELRQRRQPVPNRTGSENVEGGTTDGYLSREEARQQQTEKYLEDRRKFIEKQKLKEAKKREERWKRYGHVDLGERLNDGQMEHLDSVRENQQLMYEMQSEQGLEVERQREIARLKREQQKKEDKIKKYAHVDLGRRLDDGQMENIDSVRENQQLMYEMQSEQGLEVERQREIARLKRETEKKEEKLRKYAHVQTGRRLNESERYGEPNRDFYSPIGQLDIDVRNINLNTDYDRVAEKKDSMYQGKKLNFESKISNISSAGTSGAAMNNLSAEQTNQNEEQMCADKEAELNRKMRLARERLQKQYDESKNEQ